MTLSSTPASVTSLTDRFSSVIVRLVASVSTSTPSVPAVVASPVIVTPVTVASLSERWMPAAPASVIVRLLSVAWLATRLIAEPGAFWTRLSVNRALLMPLPVTVPVIWKPESVESSAKVTSPTIWGSAVGLLPESGNVCKPNWVVICWGGPLERTVVSVPRTTFSVKVPPREA